MTHPVVARRRAEQAAQFERARSWAAGLPDQLAVVAVVVFGSVARGDFNRWSDLDVLVIADVLPPTGRERLARLHHGAPPGLQPVGWTPADLADRRRRGDPIAVEATTVGVVVWGSLPDP